MEKKKCVVLHRVSGNTQDFKSQDNAIQQYIKDNNIIVDKYITEEGISGYSNKLYDRQAIKDIEEMALLGELDTLIVFNLDRIGRTTEGNEFMKSMSYSGVKVMSVTEGLLNGGNDTDELINGIKFWMAKMESKKISLRTKNGKEATNKDGLFAGGIVNFGYKVVNQKLIIVEEEAEIVRLIFDLYIKEGKNGTVKYLRENNITKRGRQFSQHMVADLLKDTIYIGLKRYNHYQRVSEDPTIKKRKLDLEAMKFQDYNEDIRIICDEVFYKVQEVIRGRTTCKKGQKTKYTNKTDVLFEGLLYHRCGDGEVRKLHLDSKTDKYGNRIYSYRCSHCRRNFYKDITKTYGCKRYNKVIEKYVLEQIKNLSVEELEERIKDNSNTNIKTIKANIKITEKEIEKKQKALNGAKKELEKIFMGESESNASVISNLITDLENKISELTKSYKQNKFEIENTKVDVEFSKAIIDKYKKFYNLYEIADNKQKKLLLQEVVEQIIIDGEELRIKLYL